MSHAKAYFVMKSAGPTDVADFLFSCLQAPYPKVELTINCESKASVGQTVRRIREAFEKKRIDFDQFAVRSDATSVEIIFPRLEHEEPEESHEELDQAEYRPVASAAQAGEPEQVPEGNYRARLDSYEADKRPDRHFARLKWVVEEGPCKNRSFEDLVLVWPVGERTRYFAKAFKVAPEELVTRLPSLLKTKVMVRRREGIRPDGSSIWLNNYFPIEWSPPPNW